MNLITSIHDTTEDAIVETHQQYKIERSAKTTQPDINLELCSAGFFDGLNGLNANLPHLKEYWQGYQLSYREYCCRLLGV